MTSKLMVDYAVMQTTQVWHCLSRSHGSPGQEITLDDPGLQYFLKQQSRIIRHITLDQTKFLVPRLVIFAKCKMKYLLINK